MYEKCLENADEGVVGPATYHLRRTIGMPKETDPTFWQSPAYSLKPLIDYPNYLTSPGPVYKVERTTRHGLDTNAKIVIGQVLDRKDCVVSPGPAAYLPCFPNTKRAPTPKFLLPLKDGKKPIIPPPNAYTLRDADARSPIKSRRKGYTIKWRTDYNVGKTGLISPGPAAYGPVNATVYKYHVPARTFGERTRGNDRQSAVGPQTYYVTNVECAKGCPKKFTFGIKRPRKFPPYVVPADNSP